MAGGGALFGDQPQDAGLVQLHRLRGGQVLRRQDHRAARRQNGPAPAGQDALHPCRHVLNVRGAGLHVIVLQRGQHLGKLAAGGFHRRLGAQVFFPDGLVHQGGEVFVPGQKGVGLKEAGGLFPQFPAAPFGQVFQLPGRLFPGGEEPGLFRLWVPGHFWAGAGFPSPVKAEAAPGHAGRDPFSF